MTLKAHIEVTRGAACNGGTRTLRASIEVSAPEFAALPVERRCTRCNARLPIFLRLAAAAAARAAS